MTKSLGWYFSILIGGLAFALIIGLVKYVPENQKDQEPTLIATKNGVQVWKVKDVTYGHWIYFTTPPGGILEK